MTTPAPRPGQWPPTSPSSRDVALTNLWTALGAVVGLGALWFSLFFPMVGDSCPYNCRNAGLWIGLAYLVTWGGLVAALLVTSRGTASARRRGETMWIWPARSTALIVTTLAAGAFLADQTLIIH